MPTRPFHTPLFGHQGQELCGLLVTDPHKEVHDEIRDAHREQWLDSVFATADPRIKAALKLLGYETIATVRIDGVERFCKLTN